VGKIFWVSSYPRSGNTFVRVALTQLFYNGETAQMDAKIPEYSQSAQNEFIKSVNARSEEFMFAKTHSPSPPELEGLKYSSLGLYIYRHPLDVFLSSLNYIYINSDKNYYSNYFDGKPKSVEDLFESGELSKHFDSFMNNDGLKILEPFSGKWSESLQAWGEKHRADPKSWLFVNYVDAVQNTETIIHRICQSLHIVLPSKDIKNAVARAQIVTKPDGHFYWRGKPGNFRKYLTSKQIDSYFELYESKWMQFGIKFQK